MKNETTDKFNSDGKYDRVAFPLFQRYWEKKAIAGELPSRAVHPSLGMASLNIYAGNWGSVMIRSYNK